MGELHVTVQYHGYIVEDRVVPVRSAVQLGDGPHARVSFPGASVTVCRLGQELDVRGRRLREGQRTGFSLGPVHVELEHLIPLKVRPKLATPLDLGFLAMALGVTAGGMWVDTLTNWAAEPPSEPVAEWVSWARQGLLLNAQEPRVAAERTAAVQPHNGPPQLERRTPQGEGPQHRPDDRETGWGYYKWYWELVPSTLQAELARIKLQTQVDDPELVAQVARGAYDRENHQEALQNYEWLQASEPTNLAWLEGLALAQKRMGMHKAELGTLSRILEQEPENVMALGGMGVAFARLGDYERAERQLDRIRGSDHAYVPVFLGIYAAIRGQETEAIAELEAAVATRGELPDALQLELRRDLALDPALGPLRADKRMRSALYRHLGAAAPRPLR